MEGDLYWGFSITCATIPVRSLRPAGAAVATVTKGEQDLLTLRVDVGLDLIRHEASLVPRFGGGDHRAYLQDTAEFVAQKLARGLVNLGSFRDGDVIERYWPPDGEGQSANLNDAELLRHLLTALQRRNRFQALTQEIDLAGIAMALEVDVERLREIIAEALLEGLVDPFGDSFGHTPSEGACRITAAGLQRLREMNDQTERPAADGEASGAEVASPFGDIWLEREQEYLFRTLVDAARSLPRDKREKFVVQLRYEQPAVCIHPGLGGQIPILFPDVEALAYQGLIAITERTPGDQSGSRFVDVTPKGFRFYEYTHRRSEEPLTNLSSDVSRYLEASNFSGVYQKAYRLWREAESRLRAADAEAELTTIGHKCREAVQAFATTLVDRFKPEGVDSDPAHTVARLQAVFRMILNNGPSSIPSSFLDALVAYWGEASDLIQRQEHGAQKEGVPLTWRDGRRVVFHTAIVMYEIAHVVSGVEAEFRGGSVSVSRDRTIPGPEEPMVSRTAQGRSP